MISLYDIENVRSDVGGMVNIFIVAALSNNDDFLYERYEWS